MTEKIPTIDQSIFEEEMSLEFSMALTSQVDIFVKSNDVIEKYGKISNNISPETTLGDVLGGTLARYIEEPGSDMSISMIDLSVTAIGNSSSEPITADQYQQALSDKEESSQYLVVYTEGLHAHISNQLDGLLEPNDIPEKSWELTWKKVRDVIRSMGGGNLADIADLFDTLVEMEYPSTFDPMARTRGSEVSKDVSARMFYTVMEPHLKRAIQRRGEDNWS